MDVTATWVAVTTAALVMAVVAWVDARCLTDLGSTFDRSLRHFDRATWKMLIALFFPGRPST